LTEPGIPRPAVGLWKRFLAAGVIIVFLTATATATALLLQIKGVADELAKGRLPNTGGELTRADVSGPQTIMLLGSDHRATDPGKAGNSDSVAHAAGRLLGVEHAHVGAQQR
jgi:hypothetical protein